MSEKKLALLEEYNVGDGKLLLRSRFLIPWIEVAADKQLYQGDDVWYPTRPLPVTASYSGPWYCPACSHKLKYKLTHLVSLFDTFQSGGGFTRYIHAIYTSSVDQVLVLGGYRYSLHHHTDLQYLPTKRVTSKFGKLEEADVRSAVDAFVKQHKGQSVPLVAGDDGIRWVEMEPFFQEKDLLGKTNLHFMSNLQYLSQSLKRVLPPSRVWQATSRRWVNK